MIPSQSTLKQLQTYYKEKARERGFSDESPKDVMLLLTEELGELARAVRRQAGIKIDTKTKIPEIEEEIADVFIYLLHLSNQLGLDLEEAFLKKEEESEKRKWVKMAE